MNVLCPSSTSGSTRQDVFTLMFLISPSCRFNSKINQGIWTPFCLGWKLITSLFGNCMLSHLSSYTEATVILESVISCPSAALSGCQTLGSYRGPAVSTDQLNIWIHPFILSIYQVLTADLIWQLLASEISSFSHFFFLWQCTLWQKYLLDLVIISSCHIHQFYRLKRHLVFIYLLSILVCFYGKSVFWTWNIPKYKYNSIYVLLQYYSFFIFSVFS